MAWMGYSRCMTRTLSFLLLFGLMTSAHAFDLQGHRGARGLAPENTLAGVRDGARRIGVTTLELDVAMTGTTSSSSVMTARLNPDHTRGPDGRFLRQRRPGDPLADARSN